MCYCLRKQMCVCVCEREITNAREICVLSFKKTNVCVCERAMIKQEK